MAIEEVGERGGAIEGAVPVPPLGARGDPGASPEAAAAEASAAVTRALSALSPLELARRDVIMAEGGLLAGAMRSAEAHAAQAPDWVREVWLWALHLLVVRGYRAPTTVRAYVLAVSELMGWAIEGGVDHARITLGQLEEWLKVLYFTRRHSATYRHRQVCALRSFWRWRSAQGLGPDCAALLRGPKRPTTAPRKYTPKQLRDLFAAVQRYTDPFERQRDEMLLLLLLATGLRREEVATLRVAQIELSNRTGTVRVDGKGSKERVVPIEGPVVHKLIAWLDARSKIPGLATDKLFIAGKKHRRGTGQALGLRSIEMIIARAARRALVSGWGVHRFRITFATQLYDDGVDIERIRILLGHESIETTRRYLAVSDRMGGVRLKAHRQHAVLGTQPVGLPAWSAAMEAKGVPHG